MLENIQLQNIQYSYSYHKSIYVHLTLSFFRNVTKQVDNLIFKNQALQIIAIPQTSCTVGVKKKFTYRSCSTTVIQLRYA